MERRWAATLLALAALTVVLLVTVPMVSTSECTVSDTTASVCSSSTETLLASEGSSVLFVLAIPLALAAVAAGVRSRQLRMAIAGLLTALALLGAMSIGVYFVPVVIAAWLLASATPNRRYESTSARSAAK